MTMNEKLPELGETNDTDMRPEHDFSNGKRGKYHEADRQSHTVTIHKTDGATVVQHYTFEEGLTMSQPQDPQSPSSNFFGDGVFDWQFPSPDKAAHWNDYIYDEQRHWGDFPRDAAPAGDWLAHYPWALGPFTKYAGNPILGPTPGAWDCGHYDGGVHNGSIIVRDGVFSYVYRGERPLDVPLNTPIDYICDIGLATSTDGIHFTKDTAHNPFFRTGADRRYSYEDVNLVEYAGTYYLFCNQWDWEHMLDYSVSGAFLATSTDLRHWHKHGIVFPHATRTHRNGVVLQNPLNEPVRAANGKFVMYINDGLIAYSDDLLHWESREIPVAQRWPGGEGCFALAGHDPQHPERIVLFTGGHHTGHFYAVGEVLFSLDNPEQPLEWLPRPILHAEAQYPYESGLSAEPPHQPISTFRDCIFFNGLTRHNGQWWMYYGGSEVYTCLATARA
jgi:predicted GH43/DUF377 family glycosyl hydrolase